MTYTMLELAELLGCPFQGNPELVISHVCGLSKPSPGGLAYLTPQNNISQVPNPTALAASISSGLKSFDAEQAIIVKPGTVSPDHNLIFAEDPLVAHVAAIQYLYPDPALSCETHNTAILADNVKIGKGVTIDAYVVIEEGVEIGDGSHIGAGTIIKRNCKIGKHCRIHPRVVVMHGSEIGDRVVLHPNVVIGSDGHGYFQREGKNRKLPQIGNVVLEDDVEIGACTTIDRGRLEPTIIGAGSKLDNQVQIGHNVIIGPNALISGQSAIGGSTKCGKNLILGGQSGIVNHVTVGDNVTAIARTGITSSTENGKQVAGMPSRPLSEWRAIEASLSRIREVFSRIKFLEAQSIAKD